ncbi:MAG: CHC2 zinc finger domain-containing protein [Patescibacteria group bacterium]
MAGTAELIKERLDIADIVRGYIELTPAGKNFRARCPFHKEKTPSFIVSPDRGSWHCFGCGQGGDVISFVMQYENIEFLEALKILGERAGIDVRTEGTTDERHYAVLYDVNRAAKDFFKNTLQSETAAAESVRKYLAGRGLANETIQTFEVGFAPNTQDALARHLGSAGFSMRDIETAGFVFKTDRGTYWDRFRGRVMFPIHNHFGKVVGFTGRVIPSEEAEHAEGHEGAKAASASQSGASVAKYVNSPETPIFQKSKLLFGFFKAKAGIREAKSSLLVEGQMDFLMLWQAGVRNVVATSGTALTPDHLKPIRKIADALTIFFDADEAGKAATERAIDLAHHQDFSVTVIHALGGTAKDPADLVLENPASAVTLVTQGVPAMRFYFERYGIMKNADITEKKRSIRSVLEKIDPIESQVERAYWIQELSKFSGFPEEALFGDLKSIKSKTKKPSEGNTTPSQSTPREPLNRHELIAERLITLASANEAARTKIALLVNFLPAKYQEALFALAGKTSMDMLRPDARAVLDEASLKAGLIPVDEKDAEKELTDLTAHVKKEHMRLERERIQARIREAEAAHDEKALQEALAEFQRISAEFDLISKEIYNS